MMHMGSAIASVEACLREQLSELSDPLSTVCRHALQGGSRIRAKLLLAAAECNDRDGIQAAAAIEVLHTATLLQDDIFARSVQRRGTTAAHVCFGTAQAVLASDWLLIRALELSANVHVRFFTQPLVVCFWRAWDLAWMHPGFRTYRLLLHCESFS